MINSKKVIGRSKTVIGKTKFKLTEIETFTKMFNKSFGNSKNIDIIVRKNRNKSNLEQSTKKGNIIKEECPWG
ncbi:hypothetical protein MASR2M12_07040 [Bacteroidales bacterium]